MQWIDNIDLRYIDNENIEEYTGLPFVKKNDRYGWNLEGVMFKYPRDLKSLVLSFDLRYKGRIVLGEFQEYGSDKGYHLFRAIHQMLDVHLYTHYHPLSVPSFEFTIESINIFSPNRDVLQLFLKGIRICSRVGKESNYTEEDENILFHSNARDL